MYWTTVQRGCTRNSCHYPNKLSDSFLSHRLGQVTYLIVSGKNCLIFSQLNAKMESINMRHFCNCERLRNEKSNWHNRMSIWQRIHGRIWQDCIICIYEYCHYITQTTSTLLMKKYSHSRSEERWKRDISWQKKIFTTWHAIICRLNVIRSDTRNIYETWPHFLSSQKSCKCFNFNNFIVPQYFKSQQTNFIFLLARKLSWERSLRMSRLP